MLPIKEVTGKKPMPGKVSLVRDLERPVQINTRVCRDFDVSIADKFECFDDPDVYDKFLLEQKKKNARMAEKRAKIVNSKMAREKWLKEKITKAEKDMKESVALVEKLRSARAIQKHRSLEAQTANKENVHRDEDNHHTSKQEYFTEPTYPRRPTTDPCSRRVTFANISGSERSRARLAPRRIISKQLIEDSPGKSRPTILKPAKNKTVAENVEQDFCMDSEHDDYSSQGTSYTSVDPGSGRHDSGRQSQKWQDLCPPDLQTPADCDEIDHIPVRGPSRQEDEINSQKSTCLRIGSSDYGTTEKQTKTQSTRHQQTSKSSDVTLQPRRRSSQGSHSSAGIPNIPSNLSPDKKYSESSTEDSGILSATTDLQSIAMIIDRIKKYRQFVEESTVGSSSLGDTDNNPSVVDTLAGQLNNLGTSLKSSKGKPFKLNKDFLQQLLQFESSSPLTTSSSSYSSSNSSKERPLNKLVVSKPKKVPKTNQVRSSTSEQSTRDTMDSQILSGNLDSTTSSSSTWEQSSYNKHPQENQHKSVQKEPSEKDEKLRYYIEKLLSMKHEDIQDLSISTTSDSRTISSSSSGTFRQSSLQNASSKSTTLSPPTSYNSATTMPTFYQDVDLSERPHSSSLKSNGSSSSTLQSSTSTGKHVRFEREAMGLETLSRTCYDGSPDNYSVGSLERTRYKSIHISRETGEVGSDAENLRKPTNSPQHDAVDKGNSSSANDSMSNSLREIQMQYKQKRRELEEQLRSLEANKTGFEDLNKYLISEGSLSSSSNSGSTQNTPTMTEQKIDHSNNEKTERRLEPRRATENSEPHSGRTNNSHVQLTRKTMYSEKTTFSPKDDHKPSRVRSREKKLWVQEKIMFDSLLSEVGTDSESGSMISRIDLSSDISNIGHEN